MSKIELCGVCKKVLTEEDEVYEYRGFLFCEPHFDEGIEKVDRKREQVMETTSASVVSQRNGEFLNNRSKYHLGNVASDGLPIMKIKEPQILADYEKGIL